MVWQVFRHEFRVLVRDRVLWYAVPAFAVMIVYALHNGMAWAKFRADTVAEGQQKALANLQSLKSKVQFLAGGGPLNSAYDDPRDAGMVSRVTGYGFATLAPSPTAPLAIGQSDLLPYYVQVTAKPLQDLAATDEIENPTNLATGRFDLGFVIVYLFPLMILALTFNLLSIEREQGTQVLVLSQPIALRRLVAGKVLLRACIVLGTALVLAIVGFLAAASDHSAGSLGRLGLWAATLVAYGGFWFGLSIIVNALGRKSATNAMALVACWITIVLLVPAALNVLAKSVYPVPSRIELVQATRRATDAVLRSDAQFATKAMEEGRDATMSQSFEHGAETLRAYYQNVIGAERRIDALSSPVRQRFVEQGESQQALVGRLHFLSPAVVTAVAMADLAGNGAARYRAFNAGVARYHDEWAAYFMPFVLGMKPLAPADYDAMPQFRMAAESLAEVAGRASAEIAPLCVAAVLALAAGILALRKYQVVG